MPPPSKLAQATSSVLRLVKEEASYHKEQEQQEARIKKLENETDGDNAEYLLNQERKALDETKAVFPTVRKRMAEALARLEQELEKNTESEENEATEEVTKAKDAVVQGKKVINESS